MNGFQDMLFFDDDPYNIQDVSRLGVTCVETPDGVTSEAWEEGLRRHMRWEPLKSPLESPLKSSESL